jgi:hypothetical protein
MLLIGSHSAVDAARKWRKQVRLLDPFTHRHNIDGSEWLSLEDEGVKARMKFYEIARADLAIKQSLNSELYVIQGWRITDAAALGELLDTAGQQQIPDSETLIRFSKRLMHMFPELGSGR